MATAAQVEDLRLYIADPITDYQSNPITPFFADAKLEEKIDYFGGDLFAAAADCWRIKMARVSEWYTSNVDGAFLSRGEAFAHAKDMYSHFSSLAMGTNSPNRIKSIPIEAPNAVSSTDSEMSS